MKEIIEAKKRLGYLVRIGDKFYFVVDGIVNHKLWVNMIADPELDNYTSWLFDRYYNCYKGEEKIKEWLGKNKAQVVYCDFQNEKVEWILGQDYSE